MVSTHVSYCAAFGAGYENATEGDDYSYSYDYDDGSDGHAGDDGTPPPSSPPPPPQRPEYCTGYLGARGGGISILTARVRHVPRRATCALCWSPGPKPSTKQVLLEDSFVIGNVARSSEDVEGANVYVSGGNMIITLPTYPGSWVPAWKCVVDREPCPRTGGVLDDRECPSVRDACGLIPSHGDVWAEGHKCPGLAARQTCAPSLALLPLRLNRLTLRDLEASPYRPHSPLVQATPSPNADAGAPPHTPKGASGRRILSCWIDLSPR